MDCFIDYMTDPDARLVTLLLGQLMIPAQADAGMHNVHPCYLTLHRMVKVLKDLIGQAGPPSVLDPTENDDDE